MRKLIAFSASVVAVMVTISVASSFIQSCVVAELIPPDPKCILVSETVPPDLNPIKVASTIPPDPKFSVAPLS